MKAALSILPTVLLLCVTFALKAHEPAFASGAPLLERHAEIARLRAHIATESARLEELQNSQRHFLPRGIGAD